MLCMEAWSRGDVHNARSWQCCHFFKIQSCLWQWARAHAEARLHVNTTRAHVQTLVCVQPMQPPMNIGVVIVPEKVILDSSTAFVALPLI